MYFQNSLPTFYLIDSKITLCSVHFIISFHQEQPSLLIAGHWLLLKREPGLNPTSSSSLLQKEVLWEVNLTILWATEKQQKNAGPLGQPSEPLLGSTGVTRGRIGSRVNTEGWTRFPVSETSSSALFFSDHFLSLIDHNNHKHSLTFAKRQEFSHFSFHLTYSGESRWFFSHNLQQKKLRHEQMNWDSLGCGEICSFCYEAEVSSHPHLAIDCVFRLFLSP